MYFFGLPRKNHARPFDVNFSNRIINLHTNRLRVIEDFFVALTQGFIWAMVQVTQAASARKFPDINTLNVDRFPDGKTGFKIRILTLYSSS